jgi:uncharacterized membrane protein YqhA
MTDENPPEDPARGRLEDGFEHVLALSRIIVIIPVVVLLVSATAAFVYGTEVFVASIAGVFETRAVGEKLGVFLTEVDLFLIGATLIIAAIGLYELFIARIDPANLRRPMPAWLEMKDLNDLKARVIAMIILVCAVTFTDVLLEFGHNELEILYLAAGVAIFIIALTIFLRYGSDNGGDHA